jgi:hypothetical protein
MHTATICIVTPPSIVETASTLGFASRAIKVEKNQHIKYVLSDVPLVKPHTQQIAKLQSELETTGLQTENRRLQKYVSDLETNRCDVNCMNAELRDGNESCVRLMKEAEKCNDMECSRQPLEAAPSQASQQTIALTEKLGYS